MTFMPSSAKTLQFSQELWQVKGHMDWVFIISYSVEKLMIQARPLIWIYRLLYEI
jgi:hypothetical protein